MTRDELIQRLQRLPNVEVMIFDGFNAGGQPRTINCGPVTHKLKEQDIRDNSDCDSLSVGTEYIGLGFGCY